MSQFGLGARPDGESLDSEGGYRFEGLGLRCGARITQVDERGMRDEVISARRPASNGDEPFRFVNTRDGMIVLSENTGAHEELGECALSVNPFDVQEQADAMHHALTASADERRERMTALRRIITSRTPADWIDQQLADIELKRAGGRTP